MSPDKGVETSFFVELPRLPHAVIIAIKAINAKNLFIVTINYSFLKKKSIPNIDRPFMNGMSRGNRRRTATNPKSEMTFISIGSDIFGQDKETIK